MSLGEDKRKHRKQGSPDPPDGRRLYFRGGLVLFAIRRTSLHHSEFRDGGPALLL